MSDTPDVIDAIDMALEAWIDIENVQRVRDGLLRVFDEQQLVVVKASGLSHGDQLEHKGWYGETPSYYGFRFVDEPTTKIINRPMFVVRDDAARDDAHVDTCEVEKVEGERPAGGAATKCPYCGIPMARKLSGEFCMNDDCPGFPKGVSDE